MAKTTVFDDAGKLRISIDQVGDKKDGVLSALQECAEGRCSCPTTQYERLQAIEIASAADAIEISLTPKPGEAIDRAAIDKCLAYTVGKLGDAK